MFTWNIFCLQNNYYVKPLYLLINFLLSDKFGQLKYFWLPSRRTWVWCSAMSTDQYLLCLSKRHSTKFSEKCCQAVKLWLQTEETNSSIKSVYVRITDDQTTNAKNVYCYQQIFPKIYMCFFKVNIFLFIV